MDRSALLEEFGFITKDGSKKEEEIEIIKQQYGKTGFPEPKKSYKLSLEVFDLSLEEPYFWILDALKESFPIVEKLEDSFAAAENSAFFGVTQQRLGAQQDKVSQFLATTGKMIKELFQMVRELRIIDERLEYYKEAEGEFEKPLSERKKGAEITLKGMFVDLVQGGGKSAASVYGMSRELEFITLPDLFFDAPPFKTIGELENHITGLKKNFNENVLRVLVRHLRQFMEWKKRTYEEHRNRKRFMLQYLQQHFEIIQMYINWIKPYLRQVSKLTMKQENMSSPDIISAFEGSMLDVEILARRRVDVRDGANGANGCVLATFYYRTRPEMKVVQEGYQRGPVHVGRFEMWLRVYGWSDREVENYKKMKQRETLLLFGEISASVQTAMESLGKELDHYLAEAKGIVKEQKEEKKSETKKKSLKEKLLGDFYNPVPHNKEEGAKSAKDEKKEAEQIKLILGSILFPTKSACWNTYNNFKKAHRMVAW